MRIGILSEGSDDTIILQGLVKRILTESARAVQLDDLSFLSPLEAHTSILTKMEVAPILFFESAQPADIVIFGVDLDGDASRKRKVSRFVNSEMASDIKRFIAPLFVEPHIERIFFEDGGHSLRIVLKKLPSTEPIPYDHLEPKSRLIRLIKDFGTDDISLTRKDFYKQLTDNLDLDCLCRTKPVIVNFKKFKYQIISRIQNA